MIFHQPNPTIKRQPLFISRRQLEISNLQEKFCTCPLSSFHCSKQEQRNQQLFSSYCMCQQECYFQKLNNIFDEEKSKENFRQIKHQENGDKYHNTNDQNHFNCEIDLKNFEKYDIKLQNSDDTNDLLLRFSIVNEEEKKCEQSSHDHHSESNRRSPIKTCSVNPRYNLRRDVTFKTIFRTVRKYYIQDFKKMLAVQKESGYLWMKEISEQEVREYLQEKFSNNSTNRMVIIFAAILDPQGKMFKLKEKDSQIRELTFKLLYRFSRSVMEELLGYQEFIELISIPLNLPDIINMLMGNRDDEEVRKLFIKQVEMLNSICINEATKIPKILLNYLS